MAVAARRVAATVASTARCDDTRREGKLIYSTCEILRVDDATLADLEARRDSMLTVRVRKEATDDDVATLGRAPFIGSLAIDSLSITKAESLGKIEALEMLNITHAALSSLRTIRLPKLAGLMVIGCGELDDVNDIAAAAPNLQALVIQGPGCLRVASLAGAEKLPTLHTFSSQAKVADLRALQAVPKLRHVQLYDPTSVAELAKLQLETLTLDARALPDALDDLMRSAMVKELRNLDLTARRVPAFPQLRRLTHLRLVVLPPDDPPASIDLSFVRAFPRLENLSIGGAMRADIKPLAALPKLERVDVSGLCEIDARPFDRARGLKSIDVSQRVTEAQMPRPREGLRIGRANPLAICTERR